MPLPEMAHVHTPARPASLAPRGRAYYAAAFGMTLTPGRLGEAMRLWFLEQRFGAPYRHIAGLYIADRISDATGYLFLVALGSVGYQYGLPVAWGIFLIFATLIVGLMYPRPLLSVLTAGYAVVRMGQENCGVGAPCDSQHIGVIPSRRFLPGLAIGTVGWFAAPVVLALGLPGPLRV
jgi:uncharacterized membrane protein YbhN (UPF0104 family)